MIIGEIWGTGQFFNYESVAIPALLGLDSFSNVWVFWWFDCNDTPQKPSVLQVHPCGNSKNRLTGVFACRVPSIFLIFGLK